MLYVPDVAVYVVVDGEAPAGALRRLLRPRLRQRVAATHNGRFNSADCVWWMYDLLLVGGRPSLRALPIDDDETPHEAETRWRELRRFDGWQVTSDV